MPLLYDPNRIDQPAQPTPMTIVGTPPQQSGQPAQPDSVVQQAFKRLLDVPKAQRAHIEAVNAQEYAKPGSRVFDNDRRQREIADFANSREAQSLDDVEQVFERQLSAYQADYQSAIAAQSANVDEAAALRIRDRLIDRLSNSDSPALVARQLVSDAKPEELGVVLQEIPSWLETRGFPTDFIEPVLAGKCPDVAEKVASLRKAQQAAAIGRQTVNQIRTGIRNNSPAKHLMTPEQVARYDPDSRATTGMQQITSRDQLQAMSSEQVMAAYRDGRLNDLVGLLDT